MHLPSLGSMPPPQADAPLHSNLPGATDALAALKAASKACHAAPNRPEAHYVYGQAWLALGNHVNAERAFAAALQLAPRWPEAWVNYGIVRYRQGHIEDAKTAMRQALLRAQLARAPENAGARGGIIRLPRNQSRRLYPEEDEAAATAAYSSRRALC